MNIHISGPPRFEVSRYETFMGEVLRWRDIHSSLDDRVLIATLAAKAGGDALKTVMTNFMESARQNLSERNFANMMNVLDKEFARNAYEVSLVKMALWAGFVRETTRRIVVFGCDTKKITNGLNRAGIVIPAIVIFNKAISSLKLNSTQLCTLISALETKNITDDVTELRRLTVEIFESTYMEVSESILQVEDMPGTDRTETGEMFEDEWGDEIADAYLGEEGTVMEVRRVKPKSKSKEKVSTAIPSAVHGLTTICPTRGHSAGTETKMQVAPRVTLCRMSW